MSEPVFEPLSGWREYTPEEMEKRAARFYHDMKRRRSVRHFSDRPVPRAVIEGCLRAAGTAPSGANLQPWHFVAVSDREIKRTIRAAAEEEERAFYRERAPQAWLEVLAPLGTGEQKSFLDEAPWLIAVFVERWAPGSQGDRAKRYYATESVGIATGVLITAVHNAGLVSLTHTPSPMGFLNEILGRPENEQPFLILVVGYPAEDAEVPVIGRKSLEEIATFY